jgi:hypothetical protein
MTQTLKTSEGETDFADETSRLEKLAREHPDASVRAHSHMQLAFLYVNCKNPRLNYARALQEMQTSVSLDPHKSQTDDFKNWLAVLKEVDKSRGSLQSANEANRHIRDEIVGLKENNKRMRETIERLMKLDLQIEEKRRLVK